MTSILHTILQQFKRLLKRKDEPPSHTFVELVPVEFTDNLADLPRPININDALKRMREIGRVEERQKRLPVVYLEHCKKHCIPLREIEPGVFECYLHKLEAHSQVHQQGADVERHSDKISVPLLLGARQRNRSLQQTQQLPTPPKKGHAPNSHPSAN